MDTEETAKQLLNHGQLQRHCTIIPLNKITSQQLPAKLVTKAQSLVGKDHVRSAIDVVGYKSAVKPAMQFVFGSTLLCDQLKQAQQVCIAICHLLWALDFGLVPALCNCCTGFRYLPCMLFKLRLPSAGGI